MEQLPIAACPYNYVPEVTSQFQISKNLIISDNSIREGEQASDVSLGVEGKLAVIRRLAALGVPQAQCGYPGKSKSDWEVVRQVREEGINIKVEGIASLMFDGWREEIDATIDSGVDILGLQYPISDIRLKYVQGVDRAEMRRFVVDCVRYARGRGPIIKFSGTDSFRGDLEFIKDVYKAVVDAGAERVNIADTSGGAIPAAVRYFVRQVVEAAGVPVCIHFHNDFGLALANTLAGVEAGGTIVDVSINGLGERAGNCSLDELVAALRIFYGIDLGIDLKGLKGLSDFYAELTGVPVYPYKPLVGENAFAHKLDQHVKGILNNPMVYETIPPDVVGNKRRIPIGKYTGKFTIQYKLAEMGQTATPEEIDRIKEEIELLAISKRAALTDQELASIVAMVKGNC
jgi:2-isopropylmalate synthase